MLTVGLISDTHGLLRPEALAALQGCDHLIHGGDIGNAAILDTLRAIAPLTVVRGNNDNGDWAATIPETALVELDGVRIYTLHDLNAIDIDPAAQAVKVVVSGHSHKPRVQERGGVLYVNPGSAGPRRFTLPISLARLHVDGGQASAQLVDLMPT